MDHPNVKIVQKMYDCFAMGDLNTIRTEVFARDLLWHLPGRHPLAGTKQGSEEVLAFFQALISAEIKIDLVSIWGTDTSVVEVHRGYTEKDPPLLNAVNCTVYQIRNGQIAEVQVFISDQYAVDNFFCAKYSLKPIPDRLASVRDARKQK